MMRFLSQSLLFFFCYLWTPSAARDYGFILTIRNENAVSNVCTEAESQDLSSRTIPTILSVLADPKYDLKPTKESDWKSVWSQPTLNRKERELQQSCCSRSSSSWYICFYQWGYPECPRRRLLLRSERELSDIEVLEIKSNSERAIRGLLNKFVNTSPYSKECTKAVIGATIDSTLTISD